MTSPLSKLFPILLIPGPRHSVEGDEGPVRRVGVRLWQVRDERAPRGVIPLEVTRLDRTSWRVSDPSSVRQDADRLLGYIQCLERGRYEMLWMALPVGWAYVESFDEALAGIAHRADFGATILLDLDPAEARRPTPPLRRGRRRAQRQPKPQRRPTAQIER